MTVDVGYLASFHPDHVAAGLVVAVAALAADRLRLPACRDLAAVAVVAWLAFDGQLPVLALPAVVALALAARQTGRPRHALLAAGALLLALARPDGPAAGPMIALVTAAVVAAGTWDGPLAPPRLVTAGLVGAALAATVLGGPDTEGALAAGAALVPVLLLAGLGGPDAAQGRGGWTPLVVAALVCTDAYRGRPAGLTAAAVACGALVVAAWVGRLGRKSTPWTLPRGVACVLAISTLAAAAARTIGLQARVTIAAVAASVVLCAAVLMVGWVSAPRGPARTPGA